jgi:hypothetical protein
MEINEPSGSGEVPSATSTHAKTNGEALMEEASRGLWIPFAVIFPPELVYAHFHHGLPWLPHFLQFHLF